MIIADTNVMSELVKTDVQIDPAVLAWTVGLPTGRLATTTISLAENLAGFKTVAPSREMTRKQRIFAEILATLFEGRIYAFDEGAAREYAELMRERKALGRPMSKLDAQIAAIARVRKLAVATRDRDFDDCGIEVINPWDYAGP
jgi:toxin FitB